jgi:hypothetical protein
MKLGDAVKTSLNELRMQMLGANVLFGFEFKGVFEDAFAELSASSRAVYAAALLLMVAALCLLIAPPCQHRIVEQGEASARIERTATAYSKLALLPLAAAVGCDVYVAAVRAFGGTLAAAAAALSLGLALILWFGLGWGLRRYLDFPGMGHVMEQHPTPLPEKIDHMLTESRVVLPGVQALLGFQLIVLLSKSFDQLPHPVRLVHLGALLAMALSMTLLIAPAAVHRLAFDGRDEPRMHAIGSMLVTLSLIPLAGGLAADLFVAMDRLFDGSIAGPIVAVSAFVVLVALWYVVPLLIKARGSRTARCRARSRS